MTRITTQTPRGGTHYGDVDIGPYKAEIKFESGIWQFCPHHTSNPKTGEAIQMNAMIREMGRIWTPVPEDEIDTLKRVLEIEDDD